ncbi:unnamed protein product [Mycena citricolor]|uniref:Uncharacterized protein n=1 Tax=Mycena citricolor TaxID=2018698 RepID=A0AAD2K679_9AGAR|nr:unnamed protein product [Mycena citricolor]
MLPSRVSCHRLISHPPCLNPIKRCAATHSVPPPRCTSGVRGQETCIASGDESFCLVFCRACCARSPDAFECQPKTQCVDDCQGL